MWRRRIAHADAKSMKGCADGSILPGWACYGSDQPEKVSFGRHGSRLDVAFRASCASRPRATSAQIPSAAPSRREP